MLSSLFVHKSNRIVLSVRFINTRLLYFKMAFSFIATISRHYSLFLQQDSESPKVKSRAESFYITYLVWRTVRVAPIP